MLRWLLGVLWIVGAGVYACSPASTEDAIAREGTDPAVDAGPVTTADLLPAVLGVPDRGRDPAVVALMVGTQPICSGTLVSPRLVLTARHCLAHAMSTIQCPAAATQVFDDRIPSDIAVVAGEDVPSAREVARGAAIVEPSGPVLCGADIAALVLDQPVVVTKPVPVRTRGPAQGDTLRAVGFGHDQASSQDGVKLLREHVKVPGVDAAEFSLAEAACTGTTGGPAIDEETGEVVGVLTRVGATCAGAAAYDVYTRADAFAWVVEEGLTRVLQLETEERADAGAAPPTTAPKEGSKSKPADDIGGPCATAADCAAGICVDDDASKYCTRLCGAGDRCPTHYHCLAVTVTAPDGGAAALDAGGSVTACTAVP